MFWTNNQEETPMSENQVLEPKKNSYRDIIFLNKASQRLSQGFWDRFLSDGENPKAF